jgi:D-glycero-alpha-D-manno-heptose-7-phosphate kinase
MLPESVIEASAPARIDLAGGTLDLWPLHVLHPGSVTVNLAIDRRAVCRVRRGGDRFRIFARGSGFEKEARTAQELLADARTALVGSLLEALEIRDFLEVELRSEAPFGSGLGGSSALTVALVGALEDWSPRDLSGVERVGLVRDIETRVLGKPAGVQDYYPALAGGLHRIWFDAGSTRAERTDVDPELWERHVTLFDTGAAHSSGMNNWEIFRARLEGDRAVADGLEAVRQAAVAMAEATCTLDFRAMGVALRQEWEARRRLAPVVSSPAIERAVEAALAAGAWGGKGCGAGGGGCVVFLSPLDRTLSVRESLGRLTEGRLLPFRAENEGLVVGS